MSQQHAAQEEGDEKDPLAKQGQRATRGHNVANTGAATAGQITQQSGVSGKAPGVAPGTRRKVADRPGMTVEPSAIDARMTSDRMFVSIYPPPIFFSPFFIYSHC